MATGHPKLRTDLVVSRQATPEGLVFVLKDPAAGRFFRFREAEHFIAEQLDGRTPLEAIRQRVKDRVGAPVSLESLGQFIERLGRLGLLEADGAESRPRAAPRGRVRGSLLYLRFPAFDPDRLFTRLLPLVRFCFTPWFLALSGALILLAAGITVVHWDGITRDFLRFFRLETLFLAWLTVLAVTTAHEFAHGLTCKRFGGEVRELGFMLLFFQPAFYCNVSDAWLFPEKAKRLWVTFAGAYLEIVLWAVATLTWRVLEPGTALHFMALVVMATSGVKTLFNWNPLIKLDGYYLLSDWLEIPNLRQRSFGYLRAALKRLGGRASPEGPEVTPRERRIYLAYGLLAGAYSSWLLGFIALRFGGFLVGRYQGIGFVLFTLLLLVFFRNAVRRTLSRLPALRRVLPGRIATMRRPVLGLGLLAVSLPVLFLVRMELRVGGEFTVLPTHNADVRAEVEGTIEEIPVREGDRVGAGALIARLSDRDLQAELRKAEAEIAEKEAKLRMLKAGPRREEIALARQEVETARTRQAHARKRYEEANRMHTERRAKAGTGLEKAEERLKYGRSYLDIFQSLFAERAVSRKQIQEAEEQVAVRAKELEEAQAELQLVQAEDLAEVRKELALATQQVGEAEGRLTLLRAGTRPEEIEATAAERARLEAQREYLEDQLGRVRVASPITGVVTTPKVEEKVGQHVKPGDLIAEVYELTSVMAEIAVPEKEIADVEVGQEVVLKARAYPERTFHGKVVAIAPTAAKDEERGRGRTILVTTRLENASLLLKPEMSGNAKVFSGKRSLLDLLTRRLARYVRVEFWSWW
jgi:multidrug resistance efflux pump